MFSVRSDVRNNILNLAFKGVFDARQGEQFVKKLPEELLKLKKGFKVLDDLSELDHMDRGSLKHLETAMDLLVYYGVDMVVRIIPDKSKDVGLNIISIFHYPKDVKLFVCSSMQEARHYAVLRSEADFFNKIGAFFYIARAKLLGFSHLKVFRIAVLVLSFLVLIVLRRFVDGFGASLGYLYVLLISLSGFWFGIPGGIISAFIAASIFIFEVAVFQDWPVRNIVVKSMYLRFFVYFICGIVLGYLSDIEKKLKKKLEFCAAHDELTDCYNFRFLLRLLENEVLRCRRYSRDLTIAMIDLDYLKNVNDRHGHLVGNDALKLFSSIAKSCVRAEDVIGRYGGDEFIIIFPESDARKTMVVLERIRMRLSKTKVSSSYLSGIDDLKMTFSAGIASFAKDMGIDELINLADYALYKAKNTGRNKIYYEDKAPRKK